MHVNLWFKKVVAKSGEHMSLLVVWRSSNKWNMFKNIKLESEQQTFIIRSVVKTSNLYWDRFVNLKLLQSRS